MASLFSEFGPWTLCQLLIFFDGIFVLTLDVRTQACLASSSTVFEPTSSPWPWPWLWPRSVPTFHLGSSCPVSLDYLEYFFWHWAPSTPCPSPWWTSSGSMASSSSQFQAPIIFRGCKYYQEMFWIAQRAYLIFYSETKITSYIYMFPGTEPIYTLYIWY